MLTSLRPVVLPVSHLVVFACKPSGDFLLFVKTGVFCAAFQVRPGVTPSGLLEISRTTPLEARFVRTCHTQTPRWETEVVYIAYKTELGFWRGEVKYGLPTERHQTNKNFET